MYDSYITAFVICNDVNTNKINNFSLVLTIPRSAGSVAVNMVTDKHISRAPDLKFTRHFDRVLVVVVVEMLFEALQQPP